MQSKYMTREMHERLWTLLSIDDDRRRTAKGIAEDSSSVSERIYRGDGLDGLSGCDKSDYDRLSLCELLVAVPPGFALPKDKTITILVIEGPSKGLIRQLAKPQVSIGRTGSGADIEIDDQHVSDMHCAVGVKDCIIRLCDLDSHSGTYVEDQSVSVAPLEHLSEFRIGSSVLLVTVLPARVILPGEEVKEFTRGEAHQASFDHGARISCGASIAEWGFYWESCSYSSRCPRPGRSNVAIYS